MMILIILEGEECGVGFKLKWFIGSWWNGFLIKVRIRGRDLGVEVIGVFVVFRVIWMYGVFKDVKVER